MRFYAFWFVAKSDILMRCPNDTSCFLSVVRFRFYAF